MFGISGSELIILLIVGIVVVGPKRLPDLMRRAGKLIAKLRRMSTDLRSQSGIDRILREEGLESEIRELRALRESLSKTAMLNSLVDAVNKPIASGPRPLPAKPAVKQLGASASSSSPAKVLAGDSPPEISKDPYLQLGINAEDKAADDATEAEAAGTDSTVGVGGTATSAPALRPAAGALARGPVDSNGDPVAGAPAVVKDPYYSFRLREYPSFGPDHYEALPDDLADDDETVELAEEKTAEPAEKPAAEKPAAEKPAAEKPAAEKPAAEKPAAEKPAAESEPAKSTSSETVSAGAPGE